MVRKIVHLSDLHVRTFKRHVEYQEVAVSFFNDVKKQISGYTRDEVRIVIVGDIVHQKITISNEQIKFVSWFFKRCAKLAPTIIVAGNHDLLENNKDRMDSLTPIISLMDNPDIKYLKESLCYEDDNIVWCNYSMFDNNKRPDIEKAREEFKNKTFIGLFHGPINGFSTDLGYNFTDSTELNIFNNLDIVMCGDIHKRGILFYEDKIEVNEGELSKYINLGWELDE
jgi:DNA repair exonuclease SbcCD nuclease subunit